MANIQSEGAFSSFSVDPIPGWYLLLSLIITTYYVLFGLQQLCITPFSKPNKSLLINRLCTLSWCIISWLLNALQIYSYHNHSHIIMVSLRICTGFYILVALIATYRFIITNIDSMYEIENKYIRPVWYYKIWYFIFCLNIFSLLMLYLIAFMSDNSIWFDIYLILGDITFWIGTIITMIAICKISKFLTKTINRLSQCENDNFQYRQNQWNKMKKLQKMKCRVCLIIFIAVLLLLPITWSLYEKGSEIVGYFMAEEDDKHEFNVNIDSQPYPTFVQFLGFNVFLIAIDLEMIAWTYKNSSFCTNVPSDSIYMMYCLCRDPKKKKRKKGGNCGKCLCKKCGDRKKGGGGNNGNGNDVGLNVDNLSGINSTIISSYHLEYNITEYHGVDESVDA